MRTKTMYAVRYERYVIDDPVTMQVFGSMDLVEVTDDPGRLYGSVEDAAGALSEWTNNCANAGNRRIWIEPVEVEVEDDAPVPIGTTGEKVLRVRGYGRNLLVVSSVDDSWIKCCTLGELEDELGLYLSEVRKGDEIWLRVTTEVVEGPEDDRQ